LNPYLGSCETLPPHRKNIALVIYLFVYLNSL
jgi:hypothetical protein